MFIEDDIADSKPATKSDPTASARSSIRRQRSVRLSSAVRSHQSVPSSLETRRASNSNGRPRPPIDRRSLLHDNHQRDRIFENHAPSHHTMDEIAHLEAMLSHQDQSISLAADVAHAEATNRGRMESGRARLRDALSYERQSAQFSGHGRLQQIPADQGVAPPSAESPNNELGVTRRLPAPRYVSTPPHTSRQLPDESPPTFPAASFRMAEYTPGFPPAHAPAGRLSPAQRSFMISERMTNLARLSNQIRFLRATPRFRNEPALEMLLSDVNSRIAQSSTDLSSEELSTDTNFVDTLTRHLESLAGPEHDRRDRASIAPLLSSQPADQMSAGREDHPEPLTYTFGRHDEVDGLGDRARSLSPDGVSWEILHSNIAPDERIPSTHTSFSSAATSESTISRGTNSGAASSYGTSFTSPSTGAEAEPCPAVEMSNSAMGSNGDGLVEEIADRNLTLHERASEVVSRSNNHLDRIVSLSRRLNQQRSRGEYMARHRRMVEREIELQRMEATLQALERQIEEEQSNAAEWQRLNNMRATRERL